MIEPTDEMRRLVKARMGIPDGAELDPWMEAAIGDVLAVVERDYRLDRICTEELVPGLRCRRPAHVGDHEGKTSTGNTVTWS